MGTLTFPDLLGEWLDETDSWDEFNEWFDIRVNPRTARQRHSNAMLMLRRMFKEIALLLRLQDGNYRLNGDESRRVLKIPGWGESRVGRGLIEALMKRIDEDKSNA